MFGIGHLKALVYRRILTLAVAFAVMALAASPIFYVKNAAAQSENDPNEYIFQVLMLPDWRISEAIFAYELNGKYYLPLRELATGFEFFSEVEPENKYAQGFASKQENSFTIDGNRGEIIVKGERKTLDDDAILSSDFLATDDLYVQLEVLNSIWPVDLTIDLSSLTIFTDSEEELSFMREQERKAKQKAVLSKKEQKAKGKEFLPTRDNDYQLVGKPVIDYQATYMFDDDTDELTGSNIFTGLQNIGKVQAEFSANFRYLEDNIQKPDNIRLKFSRKSAGKDYLIKGIRKFEAGDITIRQRDLIANSSSGRGITISNDNQARDSEFDQITVEGVGPPTWEIELYNNDELIDFGIVPDDGLFLFEDVVLGYGNNEIKILFFGPQGQVKEETRSYTAGGSMLKPSEFKYSAGILDSDREFILLDNNPRTEPRGVVRTLNAAYGVNKAVTVFGNYTEMPTINDERGYLTVGSAFSTPLGLFEAEAYSEKGGGNALSVDYITKFLGFRLNLTTSLFNDFESITSGFDGNKKEKEIRGQLTRNIKFFSIPIGLRFNMLRTRRETGIVTTDLEATQTLTRSGVRLSNSLRTRLDDDAQERTSGVLTSTVREGPWQFRGGLNYSLYPDTLFTSANGEIRYKTKNNFQSALSTSYNFETDDYRVGAQLGYDFERFLGTIESAYERGAGWNFTLRTTTSLHPYTDNDRYSFSSSSKRNSAPLRAHVFLDKNGDGEMNEDEEPIKGAKIKYGGGRSREETDESGNVIAELPSDRLVNIQLDIASLEDPYFMPAYEGFSAVPIKGKMMDAVFPVVETGSIEGTAYRKSSDKAVAGLELDLINDKGEVIMTVETGFDGFYVFEFVPPGAYSVQTSDSHQVDLLENAANVAPQDLYVYGHDVFINDANIAMIEEQYIDLEPSTGTEMFGPFREETFGPPQEMTGTHGNDMLTGLEKLAAEDYKIPAVLPRDELVPAVTVSTPLQAMLKDMRFKVHDDKARLVAEISGEVDYELIKSDEVGLIQILVKNTSLVQEQALFAQLKAQTYNSKIEQQGNDVVISITSQNPLQVKMTSLLPPINENAGQRLLIDIQ